MTFVVFGDSTVRELRKYFPEYFYRNFKSCTTQARTTMSPSDIHGTTWPNQRNHPTDEDLLG